MTTQDIKLKIHEESDLFSPYDPDQKTLSEDVTQYLTHTYLNTHRTNREKFRIHIVSDEPVDEERVKKGFYAHYSQELDNLRYELKKLTVKEICLGILGIILISIWLFLSAGESNVNLEVLTIIGWVAVWEAVNIAIVVRPELSAVRRSINRALDADIIIETAGDSEA